MKIRYTLRVLVQDKTFCYTSVNYYDIEQQIINWIEKYPVYGPKFEIDAEKVEEKEKDTNQESSK